MISLSEKLVLFVLAIILCGCGGGGSSSGSSDSPLQSDNPGSGSGGQDGQDGNDGGTDNGQGTDINPGISGRFFFEHFDDVYLMDISSGEYVKIPNTNWSGQKDRFPLGIAYFDTKVFDDGTGFLLTASNCQSHNGSVFDEDTCILKQDFSGAYLSDFTLDFDVLSRAKPSPDGNYFAVLRDLDEQWLSIYSLDGAFVSNRIVGDTRFEWRIDGSIVYISDDGRAFAVTEPNSTVFSFGWRILDANDAGHISRFSISPDGTRILFTIVTSSTLVSEYASLWMLDLGNGATWRVARVDNGDLDDAFHESAWSPDGSMIAVLEGGAIGSGLGNPGVSPRMYVMPSDSDIVLVVSPDENLRSPEVTMLQRYLYKDRPTDDNVLTQYYQNWRFDWIRE